MKRIICALLALTLLFCVIGCKKEEKEFNDFESIANDLESRAVNYNLFDKDETLAYSELVTVDKGLPYANYIVDMCYATLEDGTFIRCVELVDDISVIRYVRQVGSAHPYCIEKGTIVIHGTSPTIENYK